jgi:hypothetical protein
VLLRGSDCPCIFHPFLIKHFLDIAARRVTMSPGTFLSSPHLLEEVRTMLRKLWLAVLAGALLAAGSTAQAATQGDPQIKSIEAIGFGPHGLLLIGDSRGAQVVTIETGDTTSKAWSVKEVANIDEAIAMRLGTTAKDLEIRKLAVNPASKKLYIAARMLKKNLDVLMTVDSEGKIADMPLDNVKFTRYSLSAGDKAPINKITDLTWAGDRILVAALAKDSFASKIFSINAMKEDGTATCISTETFHVAHDRWETNAPIQAVIPYEEDGKRYLVGAFTCTPIVKYALDDLKAGDRVKGTTLIELGNGNTPRDMFTYEKDGKKFILMSNFRMFHKNNPAGPSPYWAVRVDFDILKEAKNVNKDAIWRTKGKATESKTDRAVIADNFHGVMHMDKLDNVSAIVVRQGLKGNEGLHLNVVALP